MSRIHTLAAAAILALSGMTAAYAQTAAPAATPAAPPAAPVAAPAAAPAATPAAAPAAAPAGDVSEGKLAWYGKKFAGRKTASGERFNPNAMTMAHKTLPFGTRVKVTNLANQRSVVLRVNDRGPTQADRVGDVSLAAARKLGMLKGGVVNAKMEVVSASNAKAKKA
jgi:rare lipoprotein A